MNKYTKSSLFMPLIFSLVLVAGIFLGSRVNQPFLNKKPFFLTQSGQFNKLNDIINYVQQEYVDTVNYRGLVEDAITAMLHKLDPHSSYIPSEDLQAMNEPLEGNFDGIGVEFHIQNDTILVVAPVSGGPSEALGIQSGDRIIKIEDTLVAGTGITNSDVMRKLRGPSGSKVSVSISRKGNEDLIDYTITRGKIPIYSIEASYMMDEQTGYIKITRFGATTYDEFMTALSRLKKEGMDDLVLDLRGNPGGYLNAATTIANEFLPGKKLIVYTEGKSRPRTNYYSKSNAAFPNGKVAVLIDEGSASASEILAGALQDWDRAVVIGRRSFGKGLVQEQTVFPDGSAMRLTIARYYTPTGRSIQKPYANGFEEYQRELSLRYDRGEFGTLDSISLPDSLKYTTPGGRTVYGGGGILPDIFVPLDTSYTSQFLAEVASRGIISEYAYDYVDNNRALLNKYDSFEEFNNEFEVTDLLYNRFVLYALSQGVTNEVYGVKYSAPVIKLRLKSFIARQFYKNDGFIRVINSTDPAVQKAYSVLKDPEYVMMEN
jgi:carboxyl-terminal processing protease